MAESAEKLLKKGTQIYLEGKLQTRQWIDKDGNKRNITEVVGESFF
jgi:single-strand DNA-binding protein